MVPLVEPVLPDADGELVLPVAGELTVFPDGELVLTPVPLVAVPLPAVLDEPVPLLIEPDAPPLPIEPDAPVPEVAGDADGD
ncbi:MAG TPA: hypothetical protein VIE36_17365 [Methylomirabilota bacterium]|jgi:hypothetical protein